MIKRTDLCICGVEKKTDIQTKGIDNVLNKTTVENVHFPNLGEKNGLQEHESFRMPNGHDQREHINVILKLKVQEYRTKKEH